MSLFPSFGRRESNPGNRAHSPLKDGRPANPSLLDGHHRDLRPAVTARSTCSLNSASRRREILSRAPQHLCQPRCELLFSPASHNNFHTDVKRPPATALVSNRTPPPRADRATASLSRAPSRKVATRPQPRQRERTGNRCSILRPPLQRLAGSEQQPSSRGDSSSPGREQQATGLQKFELLPQDERTGSDSLRPKLFVPFYLATKERPKQCIVKATVGEWLEAAGVGAKSRRSRYEDLVSWSGVV
ncbi:GATA type zinc finger transcription factor family protein [Striga asiatica]|uniref:GATA type zinc finger transcription factor family protein n=1 Tax=Striga asiatica TaxID=4170 RepID=A0A5A7P7X9_STRAF|nr:GATA type zinc finger transcription factor family protein [Striga asiatica]